jgi:hypothetical protein
MGGEEFYGIGGPFPTCCGNVDLVALVVAGGLADIPAIHAMSLPRAAKRRFGVYDDAVPARRCHRRAVEIKWSIELGFCQETWIEMQLMEEIQCGGCLE